MAGCRLSEWLQGLTKVGEVLQKINNEIKIIGRHEQQEEKKVLILGNIHEV